LTIYSDVALNVYVMPCLVHDNSKLMKLMLFNKLIVLTHVSHVNDWSGSSTVAIC